MKMILNLCKESDQITVQLSTEAFVTKHCIITSLHSQLTYTPPYLLLYHVQYVLTQGQQDAKPQNDYFAS